jgi:hypothetical protein
LNRSIQQINGRCILSSRKPALGQGKDDGHVAEPELIGLLQVRKGGTQIPVG